MKYNSFPPSLSVEPGVFVTAVDHSNTIFFVCVSLEERDPGSDLSGGESCYLRAGLWEQQVKQVILKMEPPNPFVFLHSFSSMNLAIYLESLWLERNENGA